MALVLAAPPTTTILRVQYSLVVSCLSMSEESKNGDGDGDGEWGGLGAIASGWGSWRLGREGGGGG